MRIMVDVQIAVTPERAEEARALVPAENARVAADLQSGVLEVIFYEQAAPPTHIWAIMRAESVEAAQQMVETYPMRAFFQATYTPLRD